MPFLVALAAALAVGVSARIIDAAVLVFGGARVAHATAYYAGVQPARTAAFGVGLLAVLAMSLATLF